MRIMITSRGWSEPMQNEPDYVLKICVVGAEGVGRLSILRRYLEDAISELDYFTTMESNFAVKDIEFRPSQSEDLVILKVNFWYFTEFMDTSRGSDDLRRFFNKVSGVLLIFDLTRPETLSSVSEWIETVFELAGLEIPIVLIGNKSDLQVKVDETEVKRISEKFGLQYFYTSAKLNQGIDEALTALVSMAYNYRTTRE